MFELDEVEKVELQRQTLLCESCAVSMMEVLENLFHIIQSTDFGVGVKKTRQ